MEVRKLSIIRFLITLIFLGICYENLNAQEKITFRLIDSQTQNPIPFAYIKIVGKDILEVSNEDGYVKLPPLNNDSLLITHVAYRTIQTSSEAIKESKTIVMKELAIEVNPIVISAKNAKSIVKRAIDSTYKALYEPMYLTCFRNDHLVYNGDLIVEANAEIVFIFKNFGFASFGGFYKGYLKNIIVSRDKQLDDIKIPTYSIPASFAPLNRFIIGNSPKSEKQIYYSNQEANDSLIIIGINPKKDFHPQKYMLKYGRFIINRNTGRLLRIDTNLSPEMMELGRSIQTKTDDNRRYYYYYSVSYFFNWQGILSKVLFNVHFSIHENDPGRIWQNYSEIVFLQEKKRPEINELNLLTRDTSLIQMSSKFSPEFERNFVKYIH